MNNTMKENLKEFFDIAFERHRIYCLKEMGTSKPWTNDTNFKKGFFCNVFRRLDKVSKWIEKNVNEPYSKEKDFWKSVILSRIISKIETLEALKESNCLYGDWEKAEYILRNIRNSGKPIFTSAFIINGGGYRDKITYIFSLFKMIEEKYPDFDSTIKLSSMGSLHAILKSFPGIGDFMAYEYVTDFTYTYKKDDPDIHTWCVLGVGAKRGYNRILHNDIGSANRVSKDYLKFCRSVLHTWKQYVNKNIDNEISKTKSIYAKKMIGITHSQENFIENCFKDSFNNLTMREVEHWLCEYDKYKRGKFKRRYNGK